MEEDAVRSNGGIEIERLGREVEETMEHGRSCRITERNDSEGFDIRHSYFWHFQRGSDVELDWRSLITSKIRGES